MAENMTKAEARERIEKLKKVIAHHRYLYHVLDKQEISEAALDSLKHELYKLERQFPEFITPDSPTQRVGGKPLPGFQKVVHKSSMLSMEDVFSPEELRDWGDYLKRLAPDAEFEYFAELKIDGFAISLIYEKGIFKEGSTRGDGKTGEDVTQNLKTIESIPLRLEIRKIHLPQSLESLAEEAEKQIEKGEVEIRGEVYMNVKDFERLNSELSKKGEKTFANPRNLAAGSIRQLNPKLAASRPLKFLAYDIITDFGQKKHSEEHQLLPALGFKTDPGRVCQNLAEVAEFWKEVEKNREKYHFQIDGVVVNVNDNSLFQKLGVVGKSPRGVRAFKFSPKQATTIIEDIKVHVGRTGAITPLAVMEPVEIGGVTISRASLHNEDEIKRLGLKIGDTVIIGRAGDVIPYVIKVLPELRTGKEKEFKMPKNCPVCDIKLVKGEGEAILRCPNSRCKAREREYFYHFVSGGGFDIIGLGPKIIDRLVDEGLVSDPADLFLLKEGDISILERFGERSAENLINAIQSKKKIPLAKFIYALGIRNVGEETATLLAKQFSIFNFQFSIKTFIKQSQNFSLEKLQDVPDVGPIVAKGIYDWFHNEENIKFLEKLKKVGVEIITEKKSKEQSLKGLTFVLTGGLESMSREDAKEKIRALGGDISESVSKKTDYVVAGKDPGSKYEKAQKLGVKTISEQEFLKMSE